MVTAGKEVRAVDALSQFFVTKERLVHQIFGGKEKDSLILLHQREATKLLTFVREDLKSPTAKILSGFNRFHDWTPSAILNTLTGLSEE